MLLSEQTMLSFVVICGQPSVTLATSLSYATDMDNHQPDLLMSTTENPWKSRFKRIFGNSYLSFGLGVVTGLAFDNLLIIVIIGVIVLAGTWYARKDKDVEEI